MSLKITELDIYLNKKQILQDINLEVDAGCFLSLLGPSGCGKSTLLKTICGFITAGNGTIMLEDKALNHIPPHKRDVVMVFQDMRLFPHLSVIENVAFGLKMSAVEKKERTERALDMLAMVKLRGYEKRRVHQLSGGQQQRVALARALVTAPAVLLLDEPFSGLDTSLRMEMRHLLSELHKQTGTTMVFVTHDYEEALSLSDLICVMDEGRILQTGRPQEVYGNPASLSIAKYFCEENTVEGTLKQGVFYNALFTIPIEKKMEDGSYTAALYPGAVSVDHAAPTDFEVTDVAFMGDHLIIYATKANHQLKFKSIQISDLDASSRIGLKIDPHKVMLFKDKG